MSWVSPNKANARYCRRGASLLVAHGGCAHGCHQTKVTKSVVGIRCWRWSFVVVEGNTDGGKLLFKEEKCKWRNVGDLGLKNEREMCLVKEGNKKLGLSFLKKKN